MSIGQIADRLELQRNAVRSHLEALENDDLVKSFFRIERIGRPKKKYEITKNGHEVFSRKYDTFLSLLIQKIEEAQGHEYIKKIMISIADNMASEIRSKAGENNASSSASNSFEKSLNILNACSNNFGFMSSIQKEDDGKY
jgi:DeoR family suf operon transcriptional repressor